MSNTNAFTYEVKPNGSGEDEDFSIHQTNPAWVLTFIRWEDRDTFRIKKSSYSTVRDPIVVENDCLQLSTTMNKGTLTPSMNASLVMSDINYETAVHPGDFVIVNMLNWEEDARRVANQARARQPINGPKDGFKGVYKIQGVRKGLSTDPVTGTKTLLFRISAFGFTEFNNTIYFNPYLIDGQDKQNEQLFASFIGNDWKYLINKKGLTNVQDVIAVLIQSFIGYGIKTQGFLNQKGLLSTPNTVHFFIPDLVGTYLGVKGAKAAKDVYVYLFGLQKYGAGSAISAASIDNIFSGMNPTGLYQKFNKFYYTPTPCRGNTLLKAEYWNNIKTWSILNQYTNAPLNELYTCYRISPNNTVMPTVVFRQIPFTSQNLSTKVISTKFLNLPRWKIHPALVLDQDIGMDESARINFVQFFGRSTVGIDGADIAQEIAKGNYVYDIGDVKRSGLRPYIVTTQFDEPTTNNKEFKSPVWAQIMGDALIGGHLKLNGTISCAGIVEPITIGDNLEFDGTVYHIEQVTHSCVNTGVDGKRMFRTNISLSYGVSTESTNASTLYSEMNFNVADDLREDDFLNNEILPGVSDSQDTVYRTKDPDVNDPDKQSTNRPFTQPGQISQTRKTKK